jgi:hypothetical protein
MDGRARRVPGGRYPNRVISSPAAGGGAAQRAPRGPWRYWSAAQMTHLIQRAVEQAFRLPCRYSYRHSPKNAGTDAGVAT